MFSALALASCLLADPAASPSPGGPSSIGPFTGDHSEGFESLPSASYCLRVFNDGADLCKMSSAEFQTGLGVCGACCILPRAGLVLGVAPSDGVRIAFDGQATEFGLYVSPLHSQTAIFAVFHDANGAELGRITYPLSGLCAWTWIGAAAGPGEPFQSVDLSTVPDGGAFALDDMQANLAGSSSWPAPAVYCTAKVTSGGCVPSIQTTYTGTQPDVPMVGPGIGFAVRAVALEPQRNGLFFYGVSGPNAAPFGCTGFLCVAPPIQRSFVMNTGGAAPCSGSLTLEWNQWLLTEPAESSLGAPFAPGLALWMQAWFRDPAACDGTGMSDAVSFVMQ